MNWEAVIKRLREESWIKKALGDGQYSHFPGPDALQDKAEAGVLRSLADALEAGLKPHQNRRGESG